MVDWHWKIPKIQPVYHGGLVQVVPFLLVCHGVVVVVAVEVGVIPVVVAESWMYWPDRSSVAVGRSNWPNGLHFDA
mgnify:CR=1 FL=1